MLFKSIAALAFLLAIGVEAQSGGYANSCSGCTVTTGSKPYYLKCTSCGDGKGGQGHAEIKLGSCFGNKGGNLVYLKNGAFGNSCKDIGQVGTGLVAKCGDGKGGDHLSTINMNSYIGNTGGRLVC